MQGIVQTIEQAYEAATGQLAVPILGIATAPARGILGALTRASKGGPLEVALHLAGVDTERLS